MKSDGLVEIGGRFDEALGFASRLHRKQRRKVNGVPYVSHLLGVAALVLEDGGTEDEAIAALLHDAVEDQGGEVMRSQILAEFGETVTAIVEGCTEPQRWPGETWRSHKVRYWQRVQQASAAVQRVVLADKVHNGRSLLANLDAYGPQMWNSFQGTSEDILWFYGEAVRVFELTKPGWLVKTLVEVVAQLEQGISSGA